MSKTFTKLQRLDREIAALHDRLNAKFNERKDVLTTLMVEGESSRNGVAEEVLLVTQAANLVNNGRILTDAQVRDIRSSYKRGESQGSLARRYGIAQPNIFKIVHGKSYKDVK